jgi:beta-mannosidase
MQGANWVPADAFEARVTRETLEPMFQSYVESNFNTLRNWGGGIYQQVPCSCAL